jgi:pimeloyl-ACP methyl ester carboxylesterase
MTRDDVRRVYDEIVDDGALTGALNWYRAMPLTDPRILRGKVTVPTTLVWSDGDTALGRWGVEHCGEYVDADYRFVELAGVSHWIPVHAPEELTESILARVRG